MEDDPSCGYDAVASEFMAVRSTSGQGLVRAWARQLPRGCSIIDVGSGHGEPLTAVLVDEGLDVSAIDAAPAMVAAFRQRFPELEIACEPAETSPFFDRTFDAALCVGLVFLLPEDRQRRLLLRVSEALNSGGQLLFSAPRQVCTWTDVLTGKPSWSLGTEAYEILLSETGMSLTGVDTDEGGTHYFMARKTGSKLG
ncbi:MAG: class I SAM-dependent methyltransferase [Pseudomonadota bacterium]